MTNSTGDFIRSAFSSAVNKTGKVFKTLLADPETKDGTLEKMFIDFETERDNWKKTNLYEQTGQQFAMSMVSLSVLNKELGENESMFKARNRAILDRGESIITWGTRYDVLQIMKKVLNSKDVYLDNNCASYSESMLDNGDFTTDASWILSSGSEYDTTDKFMGAKSVRIAKNSTCRQTVNLAPGTYFLHFFRKGNVSVQIQDSSTGKYWNPDTEDWTSNVKDISFTGTAWTNGNLFFFVKDSSRSIKIIFKGGEGGSHIDYIRLTKKDATSTFVIVCIFNANTESVVTLSPGTDDPDSGIDYNKAAYYSQSYVQGGTAKANTSMYNEVLENISAGGVNAVLEILNKD